MKRRSLSDVRKVQLLSRKEQFQESNVHILPFSEPVIERIGLPNTITNVKGAMGWEGRIDFDGGWRLVIRCWKLGRV